MTTTCALCTHSSSTHSRERSSETESMHPSTGTNFTCYCFSREVADHGQVCSLTPCRCCCQHIHRHPAGCDGCHRQSGFRIYTLAWNILDIPQLGPSCKTSFHPSGCRTSGNRIPNLSADHRRKLVLELNCDRDTRVAIICV